VRLVVPVEPETFFVGGVPNEADLARVQERLAG
jgi:hypothetical protein